MGDTTTFQTSLMAVGQAGGGVSESGNPDSRTSPDTAVLKKEAAAVGEGQHTEKRGKGRPKNFRLIEHS